eukprot:9281554-Pyramimonas_sp.AAC.1
MGNAIPAHRMRLVKRNFVPHSWEFREAQFQLIECGASKGNRVSNNSESELWATAFPDKHNVNYRKRNSSPLDAFVA